MANQKKIYISPPHLSGSELKYIKEAIETNWISPYGSNIDNFEKQLERYFKVNDVALLVSGTAAIHLALILADVQQDDEVICPSFNFVGSVNPILYQKAIPIFVDSEIKTWNIDPVILEESIRLRIKKGKKPKAIIMVHLYGMPTQIDEILTIAKNYEIPLIENAADALGSKYKGIPVGAFGDFGVISFNGNKIITTSGGGALISHDSGIVDKAKYLSNQARIFAPEYHHEDIGYNYMMSNIIAGIGRAQLEILEKRVQQRRHIFKVYKDNLSDYEFIDFSQESSEAISNRWLTVMLVNPDNSSGIIRDNILKVLESESIESRPAWKPMHLQPIFKDYPYYGGGISEYVSQNGLCLPSGSNLDENDLERIINTIKKCIK